MIQHSDMARRFLYSCKYIYIYSYSMCMYLYMSWFPTVGNFKMKQHPPPPEAIPTTPPSVWPRWFVESLLPKPGRNQGGARMPQLKGIKKHQPLDATFASSMRFLLSCRPGETWLFKMFQTSQKKKQWLSNFKEPCWSCSIYFLGGGP